MKPHKEAVSIIVKDQNDDFLVVKRPNDPNDDLAGVWGFPAVTLRDDEIEIDGVHRVASSKLGIEVNVLKRLGESTHERPKYFLRLIDYEVLVAKGTPKVPQVDTSITQYTECKFTNDPNILIPAAQKGSQCTQIFLESLNVRWQAQAS
jgi:ADP-ribose pyrophosphatase YjhB (NUDIX family)